MQPAANEPTMRVSLTRVRDKQKPAVEGVPTAGAMPAIRETSSSSMMTHS